MQGEQWFPFGKPMEWLGTKWDGTGAEKAAITNELDFVSRWAKEHKFQVFLGEFGVSDNADTESKSLFIRFYREQAELRSFSWGYWNFTVRFSLCDQVTHTWKKKHLLKR